MQHTTLSAAQVSTLCGYEVNPDTLQHRFDLGGEPVPTSGDLPAFGDRLERLFVLVTQPDGTPFTNEEIAQRAGLTDGTYVWKLRNKKWRAQDPKLSTVAALARAFGVSPMHFFVHSDVYALLAKNEQSEGGNDRRPQMTKTILIVDDHDTVRQALSRWLGAVFHNCLILTAATGEEAAAIARDTPPHVVVMDFGLPGMNGAEATRRIKEIAPAAQVAILTIHDSAAYRTDADEAGASAYVLKDNMQTQLVPTLEALLDGG